MTGTIRLQSHPFASEKSTSTFRLVEGEDGAMRIEKVTVRVDVMQSDLDPATSEEVFRDFVKEKQKTHAMRQKKVDRVRAFELHHVQGLPMTEIAEDMGVSIHTLRDHMRDYRQSMAWTYLESAAPDATLAELAERHAMSANHMDEVLRAALGRMRDSTLWEIEGAGYTGAYDSGIQAIRRITDFLQDAAHQDHVLCDPLEMDELPAGKTPVYTEPFFDFLLDDRTTMRVVQSAYGALAQGYIDEATLRTFTNREDGARVVDIRDMYGRSKPGLMEFFPD